jgi:polygalacturonase
MRKRTAVLFVVISVFITVIDLLAQSQEYNILNYGAVADGKTVNTLFIQKAIDECSANGGGTVVIPRGTFITGQLELKNNVTRNVEKSGVLESSTDIKDFCNDKKSQSIISINNVSNVSLIGEGTIDGRGDKFTIANEAPNRPYIVLAKNSKNIRIKDVTLKNSAYWSLRLLENKHVTIRGITIYSHTNYNNDGIDIDSKDVIVSNCTIDCDDDAICLKSDSTSICENIVISNCIIVSNCNFIKFGTASRGGFKNVTINNIVIRQAGESNFRHWERRIEGVKDSITGLAGIALEIVDGGFMDRITISNIVMDGVQTPIFIKLGNRHSKIGSIKNIMINNVIAKSYSLISSSITGIPDSYVENITLRDISILAMGGGSPEQANRVVAENENKYPENRMFGHSLPGYGLFIRHAKNIVLENVKFNLTKPDYRPSIYLDDTHNIKIRTLYADKPEGTNPLIKEINSEEVNIEN